MAGVIVGVQISYLFDREHLQWAVGVFFVYVAVHNLHRLIRGQAAEGRTREAVEGGPAWPRAAIGLPMGISAGLLGIGGGSLAVPALQMGLKVPLRNAVATSSATIAAFSWIGAIAKKESVEVQEADVEKRLAEIAAQRGENVPRVRSEYEKQGRLEQLRASLREEKTLDLLISKANIEIVEQLEKEEISEDSGSDDSTVGDSTVGDSTVGDSTVVDSTVGDSTPTEASE